jgi:hypothetical protein
MAEDPSAICEEIEETRSELADTIAALGRKADVKARVTAGTRAVKDRLGAAPSDSVKMGAASLVENAEGGRRSAPESKGPFLMTIAGALLVIVIWHRVRRGRDGR